MSAPLGSIHNWSNMQLVEDVNNEDSVSATKYNKCQRRVKACKEEVQHCQTEEQQRLEVERHRAKEQAKKCVSHFWFIMMELTVLGGGGRCATAWKRQGQGGGAASVQLVCGAWA